MSTALRGDYNDQTPIQIEVTGLRNVADALEGIESQLGKSLNVYVTLEATDIGQALERIADALETIGEKMK